MTPIRIRHYTHAERSEAENTTGLTLGRLVSAHAPRFAALELSLDLEVVPCDDPAERNRVTFVTPVDDELGGFEEREIALEELRRSLPSESPPDEPEAPSLDGAMAFLRRHTPPA